MKKEAERTVIDADRLRISFSGADTYLKCGQQYKFRYIEGLKSIPGIALLEGSAHHKAMEENNRHKKERGFDLHHATLTEAFAQDFDERVRSEERVDWGAENRDGIFSRAKILHERYSLDVAPQIQPVEIEKRFELPVDIANGHGAPVKVLLVGVSDLETEPLVLDYKTRAKSKGQGEVDNSLQLSLYSYATKKRSVGIIEFVKTANPKVEFFRSGRTAMQVMWALQIVRSVALSIQAGAFPLASPNSWACSEKFCGYWSLCRGKR